jgi:hypothetical protein
MKSIACNENAAIEAKASESSGSSANNGAQCACSASASCGMALSHAIWHHRWQWHGENSRSSMQHSCSNNGICM